MNLEKVEDLKFPVADFLDNSRIAFDFSRFKTKEGNNVAMALNEEHRKEINLKDLRRRILDEGVEYVSNKDRYPEFDCRDWAFDTVSLPEYTWEKSLDLADSLRYDDFKDIALTPFPSEGNIVMYFDSREVNHWGVIKSVKDEVMVDSKWGSSHILNHKLESVPDEYGIYAMFFEKK